MLHVTSNDDEFSRSIEEFVRDVEERAASISGAYSLPEVCPPAFIQAHSAGRFTDLQALVDASGLPDEPADPGEWVETHKAALSAHVAQTTDFASWDEMLEAGAQELVQRKFEG